VNQVASFTVIGGHILNKILTGRNPFVNQVASFIKKNRKFEGYAQSMSQSLRESGRFVLKLAKVDGSVTFNGSQSLRESGRFVH